MPDLNSTVNVMGETVTQIIHFAHGNKRTFSGILTNTIKQGEFTKMMLQDGRMLMINTANVDCIEIFKEPNSNQQAAEENESLVDTELYQQAEAVVIAAKEASTALLQFHLQIGYARATRLLDRLEKLGVIVRGENGEFSVKET